MVGRRQARKSEQEPLRTDAARNRERVLNAARALLDEGATALTMDGVARKAGVGRATLYRNFESVEALSAALFEHNVVLLEQVAREEAPRPGGFERLLQALLREGLKTRALVPALASRGADPDVRRLSLRVTRALKRVAREAGRRGEVRADLTGDDLLDLVAMLFATTLTGHSAPARRAQRALTLMLEGVRGR